MRKLKIKTRETQEVIKEREKCRGHHHSWDRLHQRWLKVSTPYVFRFYPLDKDLWIRIVFALCFGGSVSYQLFYKQAFFIFMLFQTVVTNIVCKRRRHARFFVNTIMHFAKTHMTCFIR